MYCISVNHKNSDAFIREKYALNELEKKEFYDKVRKNKNISGCICLMTCNRNESKYYQSGVFEESGRYRNAVETTGSSRL